MIHHYIYKTAVEFLILAQGKPCGSEERLILCQAATTQLTYIQRLKNYYMESLCVAFTEEYDDSSEPRPIEVTEALNSLGAQFAQVEFVAGVILVQILFCEGNFKDCADKAEVRLNEYFSTISKTLNDSDTNFIETLITKLIEALIELKQYERAKKYVLLFGTMLGSDIRSESLKARAFRKLYEQYSIVLHGLGSYNESINYCNMAIEANRHYHNAYDCLMKNYEAKGEMDKVLLVLNKAIKYEVPWDDAVTEKHRETLKMLQGQNK
jgi:tetratricopeptide (TPR) repeat protein